ncbi:hypothetical protein Gotri_001188, partial [Gossypium trilobum]|nr:hypothetical protein [Gossypium trilobum]
MKMHCLQSSCASQIRYCRRYIDGEDLIRIVE